MAASNRLVTNQDHVSRLSPPWLPRRAGDSSDQAPRLRQTPRRRWGSAPAPRFNKKGDQPRTPSGLTITTKEPDPVAFQGGQRRDRGRRHVVPGRQHSGGIDDPERVPTVSGRCGRRRGRRYGSAPSPLTPQFDVSMRFRRSVNILRLSTGDTSSQPRSPQPPSVTCRCTCSYACSRAARTASCERSRFG